MFCLYFIFLPKFVFAMKHMVTFLLFVLSVYCAFCQSLNYKIERFSKHFILATTEINCMIQDRTGYLWFGTREGLFRYDGYNFRYYNHVPGSSSGLSSSHITDLEIDNQNNLWIATWGGGVIRFNQLNGSFTTCLLNENNHNKLITNNIVDIEVDAQNNVYIGTSTKGLIKYYPLSSKIKALSLSDTSYHLDIKQLLIDSHNRLWVVTHQNKGLFVKNASAKDAKFVYYPMINSSKADKNTGLVSEVFEDKQRRVWCGTENAIALLSEKNRCFMAVPLQYKYPMQYISTIEQTGDNKFFAGLNNAGIISIHYVSELNINVQLLNLSSFSTHISEALKNMNCMLTDNSGVLWIGTERGLLKAREEKFHIYKPVSGSNTRNIVNSITCNTNGKLIVGVWREGIYSFDKQNGKHTLLPVYENDKIKISNKIITLLSDNKYNLWVGTWDGLWSVKYVNGRENLKKYLNDTLFYAVHDLSLDNNGNLWIAGWSKSKNALYCIHPGKDTIESIRIDNRNIEYNTINALLIDKENKLWVGTLGNGLLSLDIYSDGTYHTNSYKVIPGDSMSLASNTVTTLFEDSKKRLWVGTENGLCLMNKQKGTFKNYSTQDGLVDNVIMKILEDKNRHLWITTLNSLSKLIPEKEIFYNFHSFDKDISLGRFNYRCGYKDKNGKLYFGGDGGYISFNPDSVNISKYNPPIVFTGFWINNENVLPQKPVADGRVILKKPLHDGDSIRLDYKDKVISFEFAALDYNNPDMVKYAYQMVSIDKNWNYTTANRRNITYSNLPPQNYLFLVNSTNSDGVWNKKPIKLFISIKPPFWLTSWFKVALFFMLFLISYGLYRMRTSFLKKQRKRLITMVNEKTTELNQAYTNLKTLNEIGQKMVASIDLHKIISELFLNINKLVNTAEIIIGVNKDANTKKMSYFIYNNQNKTIDEVVKIQDTDRKYMTKSINNQKEIIVKPLNVKHKDKLSHISAGKEQMVYYIPLIKSKKVLGILIMKSFRSKAFDQVQKDLIQNLVTFIVSTISNALSYKQIIEQKNIIEKMAYKEKKMHAMQLRFFTNISHEFRTPLTLISAPVQRMLKTSVPSKSWIKDLQLINKNISRLLRLINELIDFRKIETGAERLKLTKTSIVGYFAEIADQFSGYALNRQINFSCEIQDTEDEKIYIDVDKMDKVLLNLLSNAFKYTHPGGNIRLSVKLFSSFPTDMKLPQLIKNHIKKYENINQLVVSISDTGKGIKKENLDNIFIRFYQDDHLKYDSSGIGLTLTKNLIKIHGGKIAVESIYGKGSVFTFCIPVEKNFFSTAEIITNTGERTILVDNYFDNFDISELKKHLDKPVNKKNNTILIVEDNVELTEYLQLIFSEDYQVVTADNGKDGLAVAQNIKPDLIISDVMMPEMDGIAMSKLIKNNFETSHIPVILLTALNTTNDQLKGLEGGADDYIPKPFNIEILKTKAMNLIKSRELMKQKFNKGYIIDPLEITASDLDNDFIQKAIEVIENNLNDEAILNIFIHELNMSRTLIYEKVKSITGKSVNEFIISIRLKKAAQLLIKNEMNIKEIAYTTGFKNPSHFSRRFRQEFDLSPKAFVEKHTGK